jgi:hypothetical protein
MAWWTEPMGHGAQVYGPSLMVATHSMTCDRDLKVEGVFSRSNLGRWRADEWLTTLDWVAAARIGQHGGVKAGGGGGSSDYNLERTMVHQILRGSLPRDHSKMGTSFGLPSSDDGWWVLRAMVAPSVRPWSASRASSVQLSPTGIGPKASPWTPRTSTPSNYTREAVDWSSTKILLKDRVWLLRIKIRGKYAAIYRGFGAKS